MALQQTRSLAAVQLECEVIDRPKGTRRIPKELPASLDPFLITGSPDHRITGSLGIPSGDSAASRPWMICQRDMSLVGMSFKSDADLTTRSYPIQKNGNVSGDSGVDSSFFAPQQNTP